MFAAALTACRDGDHDRARLVTDALDGFADDPTLGYSAVTQLLMGLPATDFFDLMKDDRSAAVQAQQKIIELEGDVGLPVSRFVVDTASAAAFRAYADDYLGRSDSSDTTIHPVASVVRQDRRFLSTTATVTTMAYGSFETLCAATDPHRWSESSDVIVESVWVDDPFDLNPLAEDRADHELDAGREVLLHEQAVMSWGRGDDQQGRFQNVLAITKSVADDADPGRRSIEVDFSLCRSIDSAVLWDTRAGGMNLNEGYLRVKAVGEDAWRISARKHLRFSDRTPNTSDAGPADFGQLPNYLAPAALTWWVETETYSLGDEPYRRGRDARVGAGPAPGPPSAEPPGPRPDAEPDPEDGSR